MDFLTAFGLLAVTAMLIFYALEERSSWYILAFAVACALGSVCGFLQGARRGPPLVGEGRPFVLTHEVAPCCAITSTTP